MREPSGNFSRRTPSPKWKSVGGVLRSTSMTAPGLFTNSQSSQIERDLHGAEPAGAHRVRDRVAVIAQRERGADEAFQVQLRRGFQGQFECAPAFPLRL